jgi:hypothetical protein
MLALLLAGIVCCLMLSIQSCSTDHGLGPATQGIRGTVRFSGTWPDSILEIRITVFEHYPVESFLDLTGYSEPIRLLSDSSTYEIDLPPGEYGLVAAACRTAPSWDLHCLLGYFHRPETPQVPEVVIVESGKFLAGIDILVDFEDRSNNHRSASCTIESPVKIGTHQSP